MLLTAIMTKPSNNTKSAKKAAVAAAAAQAMLEAKIKEQEVEMAKLRAEAAMYKQSAATATQSPRSRFANKKCCD